MQRIVTGPAADGRATIAHSGSLVPASAMPGSKNETRLCWATSGQVTLPYDGIDPIASAPIFPGPGETRFLLLTFAAGSSSPLHATPTMDYVVVLSGELWLVMEDGAECRLLPGDNVIQHGTVHAWQNRGAEPCTIAATMIGAAPAAAAA